MIRKWIGYWAFVVMVAVNTKHAILSLASLTPDRPNAVPVSNAVLFNIVQFTQLHVRCFLGPSVAEDFPETVCIGLTVRLSGILTVQPDELSKFQ